MQFYKFLFYFFIFGFNYIDITKSSEPNDSEDLTSVSEDQNPRKHSGGSKKFSLFSSTSKRSSGSGFSIGSIASGTSSGSGSGSSFGFGLTNPLTSSSIVLDFNATEISSDFETSTTIPGILKYSAKSSASGTFNKIKGNGKELSFSKKIDYVLCNSPFDNNVTVVFEDETSEEYYLGEDGFVSPTQVEGSGRSEVSGEEQGAAEKESPEKQDGQGEGDGNDEKGKENKEKTEKEKQKPVLTGLELDLLNPSDEFSSEEVGNIKCFKPRDERSVVSKIKINNSIRILESEVNENFICYFEESESYRIMVVYKGSEQEWLKYTLSKSPSSPILMDVTLIRKFEGVDPETMFVDKSTPEDNEVFEYNNLSVNGSNTGSMKSKNTGNKVFVLKVFNTNSKNDSDNNNTSTKDEVEIEFESHFHVLEGFRFYAIRHKQDYSEMMFSYTNDNVLFHEKYVKVEGKYQKDMKTVYKHDLSRTKKFLDISLDDDMKERVVFMKSLVADCVEQGLKLSHYGKFKVVNFEKTQVPTFVIFPNLEFYLNKDIEHRLILCENGRNVSFVMDTETNNKRTKYIVGTDLTKGNPFSIMARFEPLEENQN